MSPTRADLPPTDSDARKVAKQPGASNTTPARVLPELDREAAALRSAMSPALLSAVGRLSVHGVSSFAPTRE